MLCTPSWSACRFHVLVYDIATYGIYPNIVRLFYDFCFVVVILFYHSFVAINVVTLFYENVILYSHIVKLNYYQTINFLISCQTHKSGSASRTY